MFGKRLVLSIICDKCGSKNKKIFEEEESLEILKTLDLTKNIELLSKIGWRESQDKCDSNGEKILNKGNQLKY